MSFPSPLTQGCPAGKELWPDRSAILARLTDLYDRGLNVTGYQEGVAAWGELSQWPGTEGLLLAGRYAANLGDTRLARRLHVRAYRRDPGSLDARYYFVRALLERRGPLSALAWVQRNGPTPDADAETRCEWRAFEGYLLAQVRDFAAAERAFADAEALDPQHLWLWIERSGALMSEDRYDEALAAARRALELRPRYRPAVQIIAHLLGLQGRDDEAIATLTDAAEQTESGPIVVQLAFVHYERQQYADAERYLGLFEERSPLLPKITPDASEESPADAEDSEEVQAVLGVRSDIAYRRGDFDHAIRLARKTGQGFYRTIADRIEAAPPDARRVQLDVPFVRQHHVTCAPATLTAISQFWHRPVDHLSVVEAICYDGTPAHSERKWAEDEGWATREFTLTWDHAVTLLDRGVPFTLTTLGTEMGHLQAVIGYDARRQTLLIRDPYYKSIAEALMPEMAEQQRAGGPRCLALVPQEQAHLLDGLELPDAALYDHVYRMQGALLRHARQEAQSEADALKAAAPDHRLTWHALRSLAAYDGNQSEMLRCTEGLLALFPDEANLILARLGLLRDLSRGDDRLKLLESLSSGNDELLKPRPKPAPGAPAALPDAETTRRAFDPVFWLQHAEALSGDARTHPHALRLIRRVLRLMPTHADALHLKASLWWEQGRFRQALPLFRFAACLADKDERLARSYFVSARYLKQTDTALQFLQERFGRLGARSSQPARTLYPALSDLNRTSEAQQVLDKALALRPDDGDLIGFAVGRFAEAGRFDRADALLIAGEDTLSKTDALRARASLASARGQIGEAVGLWRAIVSAEPLALDAHNALSELLTTSEGIEATSAHFQAVCERFPHHYGLHHLWATVLQDAPELSALRGQVLDRLVAINPSDSWTRRERAFYFVTERRWPEADGESRTAHALDPRASAVYTVRGLYCEGVKRVAEARNAFREAVRLSADNGFAVGQWMQLSATDGERREVLDFLRRELTRQTTYGDGLLAYRVWASEVLSNDELVAHLHEALTARPDLWQAWSALVAALRDARRFDDALTFARLATERFPLQAALWIDLADVHEGREDPRAEQEAYQMALQVQPRSGAALRGLCAAFERDGQPARAVELLRQAIVQEPLGAQNRAVLASTLWKQGQRDEAVTHLKQALRLAPRYSALWGMLTEWSRAVGRPDDTREEARAYVARAPRDAHAHLTLARILAERGDDLEGAVAAFDAAIRLSPRLWVAYEQKAETLSGARRYDEALGACQPLGGGRAPASLRLCAARIEAARRDVKTGMLALKRVLDDEPAFFDGWQQLASWGYDGGDNSALYRDAARKMTELRPGDARGWGYLADMREKEGDRAGAKAALSHAFALDRSYAWAAFHLLHLQQEDKEFGDAEETWGLLSRHHPEPFSLASGIQLAARRGDRVAALARFGELLRWPLPPGVTRHEDQPDVAHALGLALQTLDEAKWHEAALAALREAVTRPDVRPEAGDALVRMAAFLDRWDLLDSTLPALQGRGALGYEAWSAFLERLTDTRQGDNALRLIETHGSYLREHNMTWKAGIYALLQLDEAERAASWCADWRARTTATPGELILAAAAMRHVERDADARAIHEQALRYPFDDGGDLTPHRIYLAIEYALNGRTSDAAQMLARVPDKSDLSPFNQFLVSLALALLAVQQAPPANRGAGFARAKEILQTARAAAPDARDVASFTRLYRRTVDRIGQDAGGPLAKAWALGARRL